MLRHTLLIIFRNIKKHKSTFFINLIGLSSGIACTLLIYLWVTDELSFDKHLNNADRLYQVMENQHLSTGPNTQSATPDLLAETMAKEMPEIAFAAGVAPAEWFGHFILKSDDNEISSSGQFAGEDFFQLFSHDFVAGNAEQALAQKDHIAISESLAKELFGSVENSIGQMIEWELQHLKKPVKVTAVFEDLPNHVTMDYDFVLSFESWKEIISEVRELNWDNHSTRAYVLLNENVDEAAFNDKIYGFIQEKLPSSNATLFIRKYTDRYLYNEYENGKQSGGRIAYVQLFGIIAIAILVIACINFINLSTAKAATRLKEVGVKKSIGANRSSLILQYIGESTLMAFLSLFVAFILVELLLPQFNLITGKTIDFTLSWSFILSSLAIVFFIGIIAGSYPAFYLTSFKPATVLKGKLNTSVGELWTRKGLVITQFTVSIVLILAVLVVYNQVNFLLNKDVGYDKENIIYFQKDSKISGQFETFMSRILELNAVSEASSAQSIMIGTHASTEGLKWEGKDPEESIRFENLSVDYDFIETMGVNMVEGRSFSRKYGNDSESLIINQRAADIMALQNPVGTKVELWGDMVTIIGVVKDFNYKSLHEQVEPAFFRLAGPNQLNYVVTRIKPGKEKEAIGGLEKIYKEYNTENEFSYKFLDETYASQYASEQRIATLAQIFAAIAILISCLGLFGLISFTAERRLKEIGIRKILGSGDWGIISLLTKDFTKIILVAIVIALPVGYYMMNMWIQQYAYQITLSPLYFVGAGLIALVIAWLTIGGQALKSARLKPTECLKEE